MMRTIGRVCLIMMALVLASCINSPLIYQYQPTVNGWSANDTIRFHIDSIPANDIYSIHAGVRYTDRYKYKDIWMAIEQRTPNNVRIDTLHLELLQENPTLIEQGLILHEKEALIRAYRMATGQPVDILIYSIMSDTLLDGITDIGLRVE